MSGELEICAPEFPESVLEGSIAVWHCAVGDNFRRDQLLVDIETDKVVLEVRAVVDGRLEEILCPVGETVHGGQLIGRCTPHAEVPEPVPASQGAEAPAASGAPADTMEPAPATAAGPASAAARRLLEEHGLEAAQIQGSGRGGRLTKADVLRHIEAQQGAAETAAAEPSPSAVPPAAAEKQPAAEEQRPQKRVPMSRLRARIAERLLAVSRDTAMLTTFNEVDMSAVQELRRASGELFQQQHGVKLGIMSFFVRASIAALQKFPVLNASRDGDEVVYHGFFDIGVAVSTERGLVVPILHDADHMSFARIERQIVDYAARAREGKLELEEIRGGTFTITNGGIFGSLSSTPVLNPPQVGILGMHAIVERPVAVAGQVQLRPMMNLALSYDHCLVDGREAVLFLAEIRKLVEQPALLLPDLQFGGQES